jgi:hypothetical protein
MSGEYRLPDSRLADIRERAETLDTGAYHGADMLAWELVSRTEETLELVAEIERLRAIEGRLRDEVSQTREEKEMLRRRGDEKWEAGDKNRANDYHAEAHRVWIKQQTLERILGEQ